MLGTHYLKNKEPFLLPEESVYNGKKPRLLLHACCAPCSVHVVGALKPYFDLELYFFNPNIHPKAEHDRRLGELKRLISQVYGDIKLHVVAYDADLFNSAVKGLESEPERGRRCGVCFGLRLAAAAEFAAEGGFNYFCTTLSVSPHKDAALINLTGKSFERGSLKYLTSDFKKRDGYLNSIRLSKEYGLYRQEYCGCKYAREALRAAREVGSRR